VFIPVVLPQPIALYAPTVFQNEVVPAISQVLPPEQFQDVPLQVVPLTPDASAPAAISPPEAPQVTAPAPEVYALAHPLLFCQVEASDTCQDLAAQLSGIKPGFGTTTMDGPNGYGVYLTYQANLPALDQLLANAPTQDVILDGNSPVTVQVLLYCGLDAGDTCDSLAEGLADIDPGFGSIEMDGPQGYGVYVIYQRDS
jgi:hypothetical protein